MSFRAPLFSTGIRVKDFRGYGTFSLELPARPCVVLLSGPNGLGKTSLFEALEWALTGSVKRLDHVSSGKMNPRDLARHASDVDSFDVALAFRDGEGREERVTRAQLIPPSTASVPAPVGTPVEDVASILSSGDPRWNVNGKNLADYLHLTHLHAQVAFLRLVTFDAKERWVRVSPLAGADRFERVRTNLTNSKKELTVLQKRRAQEHADAVAKRERWTTRLARLDQLQKVAGTVHDILSPAEVSKAVDDLRLRLGLGAAMDTSPDDDLGVASDHLRRLRVDIEAESVAIARRLENLGLLRALPQQIADTRTQHAAAVERRTALAAERDKLKTVLTTLEDATKAHRAAFEHAVKEQRAAAERHELTVRAQRDRTDLGPFEQELADAEEQLQAAKQRQEELDVEVRRCRDDLTAYESLLRERERAQEQLSAVDRALSALAEIETLEKRFREEETKRDELTRLIRKLDVDIAAATSEERARDDAATTISREIDSLRRAFDVLQKALLTIADHIRDEDTQCPVCRTHFDPGVLRGLAHDVVGGGDPKLAQAEERLRAAQAGLEELRKQLAERRLERRKVEADLRVLNENIAQLESRVISLRKDPSLGTRGNDEARLELTRGRMGLLEDGARIERELADAGTKDRRRAVLDATVAADRQTRLHGAAQERRNARQTRLEQLRARISQSQNEHPDLARDMQSLGLLAQAQAVAASNAKDAADSASVRVTEAQTTENATRQAVATTESELGKVVAQISSLSATVATHETRWRDEGIPEPISERSLETVIEKLGLRQREISDGLGAIVAFGTALDRWRQADEVRALEAEIKAECGSRGYESYALELDEAVKAASAAATVAQRAREASDQLSTALNKVTTEFGGQALRPFDELFRRYLRALIHDERFHTIAATYKPAARSAGLSFKVDLGGVDTEAEHILS